MKKVMATLPPKLKNKNAQMVAWLLGFVFLCLALIQLVRFEKFIPFIETIFGEVEVGKVMAAVIVIIEVFALPFLLRMKLSPLMRIVSMACGWFVALIWVWISVTAQQDLLLLSLSLAILTGFSSYLLRSDIARSVKR